MQIAEVPSSFAHLGSKKLLLSREHLQVHFSYRQMIVTYPASRDLSNGHEEWVISACRVRLRYNHYLGTAITSLVGCPLRMLCICRACMAVPACQLDIKCADYSKWFSHILPWLLIRLSCSAMPDAGLPRVGNLVFYNIVAVKCTRSLNFLLQTIARSSSVGPLWPRRWALASLIVL